MTLSALGIFSAAGVSGAPVEAYELIETQILGSTQASVTFSGLGTYSSTYKHFQIRSVFRTTTVGTDTFLRFNGDSTSANYRSHILFGNGSSVGSVDLGNSAGMRNGFGGLGTNAWLGAITDILDPYATKNKTTRAFVGAIESTASREVNITSGLYINTASLTSLTLTTSSTFVVGSRFSLYGIKG
jgi:hypothetical protein